MTFHELESCGSFIPNYSRNANEHECKTNNDTVDHLAKLVLRLVQLIKPIHNREY
jgi:hypothetical protein